MAIQIDKDDRFHDIRPLLDNEVPATISRLIGDERFGRLPLSFTLSLG